MEHGDVMQKPLFALAVENTLKPGVGWMKMCGIKVFVKVQELKKRC